MKRKEMTCRHLSYALMTIVMLALMPSASAQTFEYPNYPNEDQIVVKYQGNRPVISDFATALLNHWKEKKFYDKVNVEWQRYQQKKPLGKNQSILLDTRNVSRGRGN